jgi:hypothetical protein
MRQLLNSFILVQYPTSAMVFLTKFAKLSVAVRLMLGKKVQYCSLFVKGVVFDGCSYLHETLGQGVEKHVQLIYIHTNFRGIIG